MSSQAGNPIEANSAALWGDMGDALAFLEQSRNGQVHDFRNDMQQRREEFRGQVQDMADEILQRQADIGQENRQNMELVNRIDFLEDVDLLAQQIGRQITLVREKIESLQGALVKGEQELSTQKELLEKIQHTLTQTRRMKPAIRPQVERELNNIVTETCKTASIKMSELKE